MKAKTRKPRRIMTERCEDIADESRERFEKFMKEYAILPQEVELDMWECWQAAERDTRERCAHIGYEKVVELGFGLLSGSKVGNAIRGKSDRGAILSAGDPAKGEPIK